MIIFKAIDNIQSRGVDRPTQNKANDDVIQECCEGITIFQDKELQEKSSEDGFKLSYTLNKLKSDAGLTVQKVSQYIKDSGFKKPFIILPLRGGVVFEEFLSKYFYGQKYSPVISQSIIGKNSKQTYESEINVPGDIDCVVVLDDILDSGQTAAKLLEKIQLKTNVPIVFGTIITKHGRIDTGVRLNMHNQSVRFPQYEYRGDVESRIAKHMLNGIGAKKLGNNYTDNDLKKIQEYPDLANTVEKLKKNVKFITLNHIDDFMNPSTFSKYARENAWVTVLEISINGYYAYCDFNFVKNIDLDSKVKYIMPMIKVIDSQNNACVIHYNNPVAWSNSMETLYPENKHGISGSRLFQSPYLTVNVDKNGESTFNENDLCEMIKGYQEGDQLNVHISQSIGEYKKSIEDAFVEKGYNVVQ